MINKRIEDLKSIIGTANVVYDILKRDDPEFDAGDKLDAALSRAQYEIEKYDDSFDLRNLNFGENFTSAIGTEKDRAVFVEKGKKGDDTYIEVYFPTETNFDRDYIDGDALKYIIVVEFHKDNELYKSAVYDVTNYISKFKNDRHNRDRYYGDLGGYIRGLNYDFFDSVKQQ